MADHAPVVGEFCTLVRAEDGKAYTGKVVEVANRGTRRFWFRIYKNGARWGQPFLASAHEVRAWYSPTQPPVRKQDILALYLEAAGVRAQALTTGVEWWTKPAARAVLLRLASGSVLAFPTTGGLTAGKRTSKK